MDDGKWVAGSLEVTGTGSSLLLLSSMQLETPINKFKINYSFLFFFFFFKE